MDLTPTWQQYRDHLYVHDGLGLRLDLSRMGLPAGHGDTLAGPLARAFAAMAELEAGALANPDEGRQVGHYWLRAPHLAPAPALAQAIASTRAAIAAFAAEVHRGRFTDLLVIGIGGSALGPQLVASALGHPRRDRLAVHFFDNTDPDGMQHLLDQLAGRLATTLCLVISKSGGTAETRNGMLVAEDAWRRAGLDFAACAAAVTGEGSQLDRIAREQGWLARFPMWDWVGGRTSLTSAVGLLPAALQGLDVDALLAGAAACDEVTRQPRLAANPAAQLALAWHHATGGRGEKDMVVLPYRDRLLLLSRYLQQLVMESLGKGQDLDGRAVEQGIAVYGNKGSTDQHAYVQQLREGVRNFFVTFLAVLEDGADATPAAQLEVEPGITSGDYLRGFLLGTRQALAESGRPSLTLTIRRLDAYHLGVLIALFERAVGLYASLIHVNAYHQPGVEAGKKAAAAVLRLQRRLLAHLATQSQPQTAEEIASALGEPNHTETLHHLLEALAANRRGVVREGGEGPVGGRYRVG